VLQALRSWWLHDALACDRAAAVLGAIFEDTPAQYQHDDGKVGVIASAYSIFAL
jgi:hypothetical protein